MGEEHGQKTSGATVVADRVLMNLGLVLTRTKDALIKDFVEHLDQYIPEFTLGKEYTYEDFKNHLKDGKTPLLGFIESIFTKLGYDISNFEDNKELIDLIKSILLATINLGEAVRNLVEDTDSWLGEFQKFAEKHKSGEVEDYETAIRDLFATNADHGQSILIGDDSASVKISMAGDFSKIGQILNLVSEVFKLVEQFKDIEAKAIVKEYEEFGTFLKDTYFCEKFAKRILDHILSVLLQNAREIFADDINAVVDHIQDLGQEVRKEIENQVGEAFDEIEKRINYLKNLVDQLENELREAAEEARQELKSRLKVAREELEQLCDKVFKDFNQVGRIMHRVYVVLDFLKVIDQQSINLAKFVPDVPDIPEIDEGKVNTYIDEFKAVAKDVNRGIGQMNQELDTIAAKIRAEAPVVSIYVIKWEAVADIFTKPGDYFTQIYPVDNLEDAELLISKLLNVARAFNSSVPDLQTLKGMIYDLLERIKSRIKSELKPLDDAAREMFAKFENFLLDVLKVMEKFAIEISSEFREAFNALEEGKKSILGELEESVSTALAELKDEAGKLADFKLPHSNIQFITLRGKADEEVLDFLYKIFGEPFARAFAVAAAENDILSGIRKEDWQRLIEDSVKQNYEGNIIAGYKQVLGEMEDYVDDLIDADLWQKKFDALFRELRTEFEEQTRNVPKSYDEIKDFGRDALGNLIKGEDLENPFSDFDFNEYFTILSKHIKSMIPESPEIYFVRLRNVTVNSVRMLVNIQDACLESVQNKLDEVGLDEFEKRIKSFAQDLFAAYWPELLRAIHAHLFMPIQAELEYCVKKWVRDTVIPSIAERVKAGLAESISIDEYEDVFDKVETGLEVAQDAVDLVKDILLLKDEAEDIDDWKDGLRFAVKVYRAIPSEIKKYFRELVDLPDLSDLDIKLPEYSLDMKNKFLAVTLYEYKNDDITGEAYDIDASVSIKLVCFAADREMEKEDKVKSGVYFMPVIKGDFGSEFNLGKEHRLALNASAGLNEGISAENVNGSNDEETVKKLTDKTIGFFIYTKDEDKFPSILPVADADGVSAYLDMLFNRGQIQQKEVGPLVIFDCKAARMEMGDYPQKVFVGYDGGFDAGYIGGVRNFKLILRLREMNDLLEEVLKDDIVVNLEKFDLGYTYKDGFMVDGDASLKIPLNTDIDLKAVKFSSMGLEMGLGKLENLFASFSTTFTVDFKCVKISFPELGLGLDWDLHAISRGDFDLSPRFKMPDGLSISLDLDCVKGTGLIKWNRDKGEYLGALELQVLKKFGVSALMLLNTKLPDGQKGMSLVAMLSTIFKPDIPLGMGFSLTGIGGSLGKDRRLNIDLIRSGVRDGSLMSSLMVRDLDKNMDNIFANVVAYYPISRDTYFLGFMGQILWAKIFKVDAGMFIQVGDDFSILIAGVMSLDVSDKLDKLLSLNVAVMGAFEPARGISLDASLFDSQIVGIELFGDMAMRIFWGGETKGFLFSAGGFHPQYVPEAGFMVNDMQRLGFRLDYSILKVSLETYFAITSNSVQFGADARLQIGWDKFGLIGRLYFNTLFQFNPFRFMFDIGFSVAVKVGTLTLLSIGLDFAMEGPAKWRVKGHAIFWLLFIKIEPEFDLSWGKSQEETEKITLSVYPLLADTIQENNNWLSHSTDLSDALVGFDVQASKDFVMQPSDILAFTQSAVPIAVEMDKYGEAKPGDARKIKLAQVLISGREQQFEYMHADFAPSLVTELTDKEKLTRPSYEPMPSGFVLDQTCSVRQGMSIETDQSREYRCQQDGFYLRTWMDLVNAYDSSAPAKAAKVENLDEAGRKSSASHRRSEEGFRRYVRKMDELTNR